MDVRKIPLRLVRLTTDRKVTVGGGECPPT